MTGETVRLSALRGRAVVLNFWATWCQPCRVETPWLVDLDRRYRARGLEIVGVSLDDPGAEVAKFVRENRVSYPILLDGKSIAAEYGGARYLPQTILIDRKGRVVDSLSGLERRNVLENRVRRLLKHDGRS